MWLKTIVGVDFPSVPFLFSLNQLNAFFDNIVSGIKILILLLFDTTHGLQMHQSTLYYLK